MTLIQQYLKSIGGRDCENNNYDNRWLDNIIGDSYNIIGESYNIIGDDYNIIGDNYNIIGDDYDIIRYFVRTFEQFPLLNNVISSCSVY